MRADPDFTAYVVARRPWVVRAYVLLGVPTPDAEEWASDVFADVMPAWGSLRHEGDRDVEVARVVLDRWTRAGVAAPLPVAVPAPRLLTSELEERLALLARLGDGLSDLQEMTRLAVVLHHVLGLDAADTAAALGQPPAAVEYRLQDAAKTLDLGPLDSACHEAAAAIDVSPPDLAEIAVRSRSGRRRRWGAGVAVAAALVLVAVTAALLLRPEPTPRLASLEVTSEENPVGLAWWLNGQLHLQHGTVRVPGVRHLVEAGDQVVYGDGDGLVVAVAEDGSRVELGTMDVGTPLVSSPRAGLVAWLESSNGDLVVWSASTGRVEGSLAMTRDAAVLGWDRERLYLRDDGIEESATLGGDGLVVSTVSPPISLRGGALTDVAIGAQLWADRGSMTVVQALDHHEVTVPGSSGQLSPDGRFVITVGRPGGPAAYDAVTGEALGTWFPGDWTTMAAAFTAEGRAVWSVARVGSYALIDCLVSRENMNSFDVGSQPCTPRLDLHGVPVLAGGEPGLVPST